MAQAESASATVRLRATAAARIDLFEVVAPSSAAAQCRQGVAVGPGHLHELVLSPMLRAQRAPKVGYGRCRHWSRWVQS
ncbi:MAG: hypothetical protein DLM59_04250 [Pseudonocardiales bacterium]|nr:MAG: hypothetical protein DLM59_04250 [Pseudonocardiales bacterium]